MSANNQLNSLFISARHRVEYCAFRFVRFAFRLFPLDLSSTISGRFWRAIAPFTKRHERALTHLKMAFPEKSANELDTIARQMWENLGQVSCEALQLDRFEAEPDRIVTDFEDTVTKQVSERRGAILVGLHYGNWEIYGLALHRSNMMAAAAYQKASNPLVENYIRSLRERYFHAGMFAKDNATARKLLSIAKSGVAISMLADLRDVSGVKVPFFGYPANMSAFPALMARSLNLPLYSARIIRTGTARYRFETTEIPVQQTANKKQDIEQTTKSIQKLFETWISQAPEQWTWAHRKWHHADIASFEQDLKD